MAVHITTRNLVLAILGLGGCGTSNEHVGREAAKAEVSESTAPAATEPRPDFDLLLLGIGQAVRETLKATGYIAGAGAETILVRNTLTALLHNSQVDAANAQAQGGSLSLTNSSEAYLNSLINRTNDTLEKQMAYYQNQGLRNRSPSPQISASFRRNPCPPGTMAPADGACVPYPGSTPPPPVDSCSWKSLCVADQPKGSGQGEQPGQCGKPGPIFLPWDTNQLRGRDGLALTDQR